MPIVEMSSYYVLFFSRVLKVLGSFFQVAFDPLTDSLC